MLRYGVEDAVISKQMVTSLTIWNNLQVLYVLRFIDGRLPFKLSKMSDNVDRHDHIEYIPPYLNFG